MDVLTKIDQRRKKRGWSINNLAMEAMLTQSTVQNLYVRKTEPKLSTLRAICGAFGMTLSEFFADETPAMDIDDILQQEIKRLSPTQKQALFSFLRSLQNQ